MSFLCEDIVVIAPGKRLQLNNETWCALLGLGFGPMDVDEHGRIPAAEQWKEDFRVASLDTSKLPVSLSAERAAVLAGQLRQFSRAIPEAREIGEVLDVVDRCIHGQWRKFAVTSRKGWIECDDVAIVFMEQGKAAIEAVIELFERGPVKVDLAERSEPGPRLRVINGANKKR